MRLINKLKKRFKKEKPFVPHGEEFYLHIVDHGDSSVGIWGFNNGVKIKFDYPTEWLDEELTKEFVDGLKEYLHEFFIECQGYVITEEEYQDRCRHERECYEKL